MKLYLIQHALAKTKEEDPERPISDQGRSETEMVASYVVQSGRINASLIAHSGKKRAAQTAHIFAEKLDLSNKIRQYPGLAPMDEVTIWSKKLNESSEDIMLVGHMPHLKYLASYLLTGNSLGMQIDFKNAGVVCLERDDGNRWALSWILIPSLIPR